MPWPRSVSRLIEGVHRHRAGRGRPALARGERVGVAIAGDDQLGAVAPDRSIFAGDATVGTKIARGMPSRDAAKATATPWLPPDAATTPAAGTCAASGSRTRRAP